MTPVIIEENLLEEAVLLLREIPEFSNIPETSQILERLASKPHLILTAHSGARVIGCKLGYERDGRFYSWLGAVHPDFRQNGIASILADRQENWAREQGYSSIWMKTRNAFPEMLIMALRRGFQIIGLDLRDEVREHRIILEKKL